MRHYTFGTFLIDPSNRQAAETCLAIASLRPVSPMPVLLLGERGYGKTHLCTAIVNHVRANTSKTGLAYVTAQEFPDQVRALIDDPSHVQRAQSAILIVDDLDRFRDLVEELEAVVRIFLDHHHPVVLASAVHPSRLQNLTSGLRALISAGQMIAIAAPTTERQIDLIKRQARVEAETQIRAQQQEIEALRAQTKGTDADAGAVAGAAAGAVARKESGEEAARLRAQIETLGGQLEEAKAELADRIARETEASADHAEVLTEIAALRQQVEALRQQLEAVRQQLQTLQSERKAEQEAAARTEGQLREQLRTVDEERRVAREEATQLLERASKLVAQVDAGRTQFTQAEGEYRQQIEGIEALLDQLGVERAALARRDGAKILTHAVSSQLNTLREQFEEERKRLEAALSQTQQQFCAELNEARVDLNELVEARAQAEAEIQRLRGADAEYQRERATFGQRQAELESRLAEIEEEKNALQQRCSQIQQDLAAKTKEYDGLEREAAALVAAAHAKAGEAEGQLAKMQGFADHVAQINQHAGKELAGLAQWLSDAAQTAIQLSERLAAIPEAPPDIVDPLPHGKEADHSLNEDKAAHEGEAPLVEAGSLRGDRAAQSVTPLADLAPFDEEEDTTT